MLRVLAEGPTYGYEISARLAEGGLGPIKGGTLYPLLNRFEQAGRVQIEWRPGDGGPGRKYYLLTEEGHAALAELTVRWREFTVMIEALLTTVPQKETS